MPLNRIPDDLLVTEEQEAEIIEIQERLRAQARKEKVTKKRGVIQVKRLEDPFARVRLSWLTDPLRSRSFNYETKLLLLLLYKSKWGQKAVKLTDAVAAKAGVPDYEKRRCIPRLVRNGWLMIEDEGGLGAGYAVTVRMLLPLDGAETSIFAR